MLPRSPVPTLGNRITFSAVIEVCDELLEGMARRTGVAGKIREILLQTLANRPTLDEIARLLGTTARTLRRQLRDENVNFRQLMDDLRAHIATFRRWTNKTPGEVRRLKHRERAPRLAM
jgi:hypothetical protein